MPDKDNRKGILKKVSDLTIRAAIAENPSIMTASGWRVDDSGSPVQDSVDDPAVVQLRKNLAEISSIPFGDMAGEVLLGIPYIQKGLAALGTKIKRYSPEGRRLTRRIKAAISKIDETIKSANQSTVNPELREYLIKEGVDPKILTDDTLEKLTRGRQVAIENAAESGSGRYVMRLSPTEDGQYYVAMESGYPSPNLTHRANNQIGYLHVEPTDYGYPGVEMVENVTRKEDKVAHGVNEALNNAVIQDKGSLVTGRKLHSPEKTMHIIEKYPNREVLDNRGVWSPWGADVLKETAGHPVYLLKEPTYNVPLKNADVFSATSISPDGSFIVDFAKDAYHEDGGKLIFGRGGRKHKTLLTEPYGYSGGNMSGGRAGDPRRVYAKSNNKCERIGNNRYWLANDSLVRSGSTPEDADRLARILAAQSALEAGWVDDVKGNNFAGYMSNGKRMSFNSPDEFWDYHIRNLDKKWPGWRQADSVKAYYDIVNNTALGLDTKEKFDAYNRAHRDNPAYIYAPAWENENYLGRLSGVYDRYINKYVPAFGNALSDGGKIHIKPSHRGKLTELKKRTGKTEAELYNDGNPSHKKMVVFARNSRKWKHSDGGYISKAINDGKIDILLAAINNVKNQKIR